MISSRYKVLLIAAPLALVFVASSMWWNWSAPGEQPSIITSYERTGRPPTASRDSSHRLKPASARKLAVKPGLASEKEPKSTSVSAPIPAPPKVLSAPGATVAAGGFDLIGDSGKSLGSGSGSVALKYLDGRYYAVVGSTQLASSQAPIKVTPKGNAILSLPGYIDMNWNKTVNLNQFRGSLELSRSGKTGKLWVVNELSVEDYVAGIGEASADAPVEHLKVMADIARSYAWWHRARGGRHAGEPFHLKNSRNGNGDDQIYQGYVAESRLPRYASAARQTAGEAIFYEGRPVITPYSTRAGGRTRSPAEAGWNVDWPWVVSVPDPDTAGMTRLGHGVGLSGYGSRKRAERGDGHGAILAYYFRGTTLGHVDSGNAAIRVAIYSP